jgi:hypothetical protein
MNRSGVVGVLAGLAIVVATAASGLAFPAGTAALAADRTADGHRGAGGHAVGAAHGGSTGGAPVAGRGGFVGHPAPRAADRGRFEGRHEFHRDGHGGVFIGVSPFVWGGDPYWSAEPYVQPAPAPYWYYCPSAGAYYPYVSSCAVPWVPVQPQ